MADHCMLNFTKEQVVLVGEYCSSYSSPFPHSVQEQLTLTGKFSSEESVMAPSPSQCTRKAACQIINLDLSERYLQIAQEAFHRYGADDRIQTLKGPCANSSITRLPTLRGQFDLIYIDAAEEEYKGYTQLRNGMNAFNGHLILDERVEVTMIPLFNGVTQIMWK
ncbi:O-methyltransferase [Aspergillus foveolatus]|uniref:O-methyltransferase n=1 Tax=Aspergillus foveolatus TaxID=210207 RepID=UPI003CCCE631